MPRPNETVNPATLVLSASAGCASRAAAVAGCAMTLLGEGPGGMQRIELSKISPAALYEGLPSDRLDDALGRVSAAEVIVVIAPVEGAAFSGLLPAFFDRAPKGTFTGKVVVPLLLGGDPAALARFESTIRRHLERAGAVVALGDLFDASDDFSGGSGDAAINARIERAIREGMLAQRSRTLRIATDTGAGAIGPQPRPVAQLIADEAGSGAIVQTIGRPVPMAC